MNYTPDQLQKRVTSGRMVKASIRALRVSHIELHFATTSQKAEVRALSAAPLAPRCPPD